jgi:hypothetical protein
MAAYPRDLAKLGYVEEEYFISGEATNYQSVGPFGMRSGKWTVTPGNTRPYKTRLLVHRPTDPTRFNGTVLVEWINVSPGFELVLMPDDAIYDGFAYVGVSAQYVGIHGFDSEAPQDREGMIQWDPERYTTLYHPGDSYCFDIYTQAARALRAQGEGVHPLGGLRPLRLVGAGGSQSAMRIRTYVNALHLRDRVFDAYLPFLDYGNCCDLSDTIFEPHFRTPEYRAKVFRYPVVYRDDVGVPIMLVNSEKEASRYRDGDRGFLLQPDTDRFRHWEVAGAPHAADLPPEKVIRLQIGYRDKLHGPRKRWPPEQPSSRPGSHVSAWPTTIAAIHHLHRWMNEGVAPPSQPLIEFTSDPLPLPVRDEFGIAKGGVRLPETDVPIEMNTGLNDEPGLAENRGLSVPFAAERLRTLYPTHEDYVRKIGEAAHRAEREGVILPYRTAEYIADAKATKVPTG